MAYNKLSKLLLSGGYYPIVNSSGLWKHKDRKTLFSLCVDDFGVKCFSNEDALHLQQTIQQEYTVTVDWAGRHFLGYQLTWDYARGHVDISIPDYIKKALDKLQHILQTYPQYSPHYCPKANWTQKGEQQYVMQEDTSPLLSGENTKYIQQVVGTFLYYARALDCTMLPAVNTISTQQAMLTQLTMK